MLRPPAVQIGSDIHRNKLHQSHLSLNPGVISQFSTGFEVLGLKEAPGFHRSSIFLCCLGAGAVFWVSLPFVVIVQPLSWQSYLSLAFLIPTFWQPVVEEILFRGLLQGGLSLNTSGQRSMVGISAANLLTSVVFTSAHFGTHPLFWASLTFLPSLLFGVLRDRSGSILPSIALHMIYNAGYFILTGAYSLM